MNVRKCRRGAYLLLTLLLCGILILFTACKPALPTPSGVNVDQITLELSWNPVTGADYYTVRIGGKDGTDEVDTGKNSYALDYLPEGTYTLSVKAVAGASSGESGWSESITFLREHETGLTFRQIDSNTAFEVSGMGTAQGDVVVPAFYRGLPVTRIGDQAFRNKNTLTSVVIGANVREIGEQAFSGCSLLKSVQFGEGLLSIGAQAFQSCRAIDSAITLPGSLVSIGDQAFEYCRLLPAVTFGGKVAQIGASAFEGCEKLTELTLPDSVTSLGTAAFAACTALERAAVGSGIAVLDAETFRGCSALTDVSFGSVQSIGESAFEDCAALGEITLPGTVTSIGKTAFRGCAALEKAELPEGLASIGAEAFNGTKLWNDGADNYLGNWFLGTGKQSDVSIRQDTVGIADGALEDYQGFSGTLNIPDSVKHIGARAFAGSTLTSVVLGGGVQSIGDEAFDGCEQLSIVILGKNAGGTGGSLGESALTSIGSYAFRGCKALTAIDLPESLSHIGTYAFRDSGLWESATREVFADDWLVECKDDGIHGALSFSREDGGSVRGIADYALYGCDFISAAYIPESVEYIGRSAFYNCTNLSAVTLPSGLAVLEDYTFYGCTALADLQTRVRDEETQNMSSVPGLPASLTSIGRSAFYKCALGSQTTDSESDQLVIPDAVTEIGDYAFYGCGFTVTEDETETACGIDAVVIGSGVKTIGYSAFANMGSLKSVILGENVQTVGDRAFYRCAALREVRFGNSVRSVGERAFYGCTSLTAAEMPESLTSLGAYAFYNCASLGQVSLGNIAEIGDYTFFGCASLTEVSLPAGLRSVGRQAFRNCSALAALTLRAKVAQIGAHAFYGCNSLTVYTDAAEAQEGWNARWNSSYRPVVYGCSFSQDGCLLSFRMPQNGIENTNVSVGISAPVRAGFVFAGWAESADGEVKYALNDLSSVAAGTTLYAVWTTQD